MVGRKIGLTLRRSQRYGPASGDKAGNFVIYDSAFESGNNLAQILAHEIAHRVFESFSKDDIEGYRFPAGWANIGTDENPDYVLVRNKMVDPDSANGIEEDFANNVEFYLFNPLKLKEVSPGAYNWISKHFGAKFKIGKGSP